MIIIWHWIAGDTNFQYLTDFKRYTTRATQDTAHTLMEMMTQWWHTRVWKWCFTLNLNVHFTTLEYTVKNKFSRYSVKSHLDAQSNPGNIISIHITTEAFKFQVRSKVENGKILNSYTSLQKTPLIPDAVEGGRHQNILNVEVSFLGCRI